MARQPRQPGDVESAVRFRPVLMRDTRLRDYGVAQLICRDVMIIIIVVTATIVAVDSADRTDAVNRVLGG